MTHSMTPQRMIDFEKDIAEAFERKEIRAPIHLSGGNERQLFNIFNDFKEGDYCFSTWRSHFHALLAGVPPEKVKTAIIAGKSMTLCWPEHRFFSSAIFAGCCPIALGVAWQIKQRGGKEMVYCFLGDMAEYSGLFRECLVYAVGHRLPIKFIIEDNGKSVCTDTMDVWKVLPPDFHHEYVRHYYYQLPWPHSGSGKRIEF